MAVPEASRIRPAALIIVLIVAAVTSQQAVADLGRYDRIRVLEPGRKISGLELVDQDGNGFALSELQGKVALIFFGFTNCPDVCPATMTRFRQFERSGLVDTDDVAFVLISVDPERDTPERLTEFLAQYSPDFVGLTGERATIKRLAKDLSVSFFPESPDPHSGHYDVAHSPQSFMLDTSGRLVAELYDPPLESLAGMVEALLRRPAPPTLSAEE